MHNETDSAQYARRLGARLRAVRKQKRLSLQAVEASSDKEFKASVLGAYERGERAISVNRLQRLASFYKVPVDQLLPRDGAEGGSADRTIDLRTLPPIGNGAQQRQPAAAAPQGQRPRVQPEEGKLTIDLGRLQGAPGPEKELLRRYLSSIQVRRGDFNGRMLTIRDEDVRAIACLFDVSPEVMRARLEQIGLLLRV